MQINGLNATNTRLTDSSHVSEAWMGGVDSNYDSTIMRFWALEHAAITPNPFSGPPKKPGYKNTSVPFPSFFVCPSPVVVHPVISDKV